MKNLIVRLANGIGNQLFTYAAAFNYSKKIRQIIMSDNLNVDEIIRILKKKHLLVA